MHDIPDLDRRGLRKFGLTTGAIMVMLFGLVLPWLRDRPLPLWPWCVAAVLAVWALAAPASLTYGVSAMDESRFTARMAQYPDYSRPCVLDHYHAAWLNFAAPEGEEGRTNHWRIGSLGKNLLDVPTNIQPTSMEKPF